MRFLIFTYLAFNLLFIFSSCSYKQDQLLFKQKSAYADTITSNNTEGLINYRIKPQDILQIRNLQNINYLVDMAPQNSVGGNGNAQGAEFQVEEDGNVALPVIGRVQVSGLTRIEATNKIEGLYKTALLKDPIIELKIVNLKVTILGEVRGQGNYPLLKDRTTLVEMIGQAGGLTDRANEKNIEIIRGAKENPTITIIDLGKVNSINDPQTILQNGDIIYIAENRRAIRTDKLQDFSTIIQPALILFNTVLIIFTFARR